MKREALRHPKMLDLAARLRIPREHAIGTMDVLLDWVHDMAPQGDVGKWPDGAIAVASGWTGDPSEFINALIGARWLDQHPRHRLLVHDYPDHAERFVKAKLAKNRQWFCYAYYQSGRKWDAPNGIRPPEDELRSLPSPTVGQTAVATTGPPIEPTVPRDQTKPNQTKPNHPQTPAKVATVNGSEKRPSAGLAGGWDDWNVDSEAQVRLDLEACGYKRFKELISECRAAGMLPRDIINVCIEFRANQGKLKSPGAIAERLRTGIWPADNVLSEEKANERRAKKDNDKFKLRVESIRKRLINEVDNDARNWSEEMVIARANELKVPTA